MDLQHPFLKFSRNMILGSIKSTIKNDNNKILNTDHNTGNVSSTAGNLQVKPLIHKQLWHVFNKTGRFIIRILYETILL